MTTDPEKAREIKLQLVKTFDEIAHHFDITRYKPWPESKRFISTLAKDSLVLDLGCGNGRNSFYLAGEGMKVLGLDFSKALLKIAQNKTEWKGLLDRVDFLQSDTASLPLKSEGVDAILYIATVHHLPTKEERYESMREVNRCLKPGGRALVSAWAQEQEKFREELKKSESVKEEGFEYGDIFLPWKMKDGRVYQRYYHLFSKGEFEELMENSGLETERIFWSSDNHYAELRKI
jgi:ubiquinone/menaquinone biosynthesis C-methylase UbiE